MLGITVGEIAEATGGKIIFGNKNDKIESIMTDSRKKCILDSDFACLNGRMASHCRIQRRSGKI